MQKLSQVTKVDLYQMCPLMIMVSCIQAFKRISRATCQTLLIDFIEMLE